MYTRNATALALHALHCTLQASPVGPSRMMLMDLGIPRAAGVGRCSLFSQGGSGAPKLCILVRVRRANASAPHVWQIGGKREKDGIHRRDTHGSSMAPNCAWAGREREVKIATSVAAGGDAAKSCPPAV